MLPQRRPDQRQREADWEFPIALSIICHGPPNNVAPARNPPSGLRPNTRAVTAKFYRTVSYMLGNFFAYFPAVAT
jgi:hypothetical protein